MAEEDIDLVVHLGDYMNTGPKPVDRPALIVLRSSPHVTTATGSRSIQNHLNLQAAHAAPFWIVTWDDHEVDKQLR